MKRAGDEVRTRDLQLGRLSLYQLSYSRLFFIYKNCHLQCIEDDNFNLWGEKDSNLRSHKTTDLQSVPVGRFGISPTVKISFKEATLSIDRWRFL